MPSPPCPVEGCPFPDLECTRGYPDPLSECDGYTEQATATASQTQHTPAALPWTGGALGTLDLAGIATVTRPHVIGIVGLSDAGKSSVLSRLYLLLTRGHELRDRTFAGSRTLHGWELLADPSRLPPKGTGAGFPEHTTSLVGEPGLLHLAFRHCDGHREDILISDAPGEWFKDWAENRNAPSAEGARWITDHADAAVLFIDSDALRGPDRGTARAEFLPLIHRTGEAFAGRPVVVLWAKADLDVPKGMRKQIEAQVERHLPGGSVISTTVCPAEWTEEAVRSLFSVFETLLDTPSAGRRARPDAPDRHVAVALASVDAADPLLSFRGYSA